MDSKPTHKGTKTYSLSTTSAAAAATAATTSQRPFHPIVKLGGSCGEGRRDENTEKEREEKTPKKQKKTNKQTNKPTEEATITNQWERCASEMVKFTKSITTKFSNFSRTQKFIISPKIS
jgi:hypothetical protein